MAAYPITVSISMVLAMAFVLNGRGTLASKPHTEPPESYVGCTRVYQRTWHSPYRSYAVKVATCDALGDVRESIEDLSDKLNEVNSTLSEETEELSHRLDKLEDCVDDLKGEGEILYRLFYNGVRVCRLNTFVEVSEICKFFYPEQVIDPFVFHVDCNSELGRSINEPCWTFSFLVKPNCIQGSQIQDFSGCFESPPPGFVCEHPAFFGCFGFTKGPFDDNVNNRARTAVIEDKKIEKQG
ncbi:uncharacterized protein LOC143295205 [Babylonia areolata]|uniref:uncharacterized protein LOC143295205 n=1 Tax=Babylonia areolata TaxID=304850 RepID=UPI003FD0BCB5